MGSGHFQVLPTVLSERGKWAEVLHAGSNAHQNFPFCVVSCTSWPQRSVDKGEQWFHISVFLFLKFLWKILCSTSLSVQALGNYRQVCVGEESTPQNLSVGDCFLYFPWLALAFFSKLSSGKCVECSWGMSWTPSIESLMEIITWELQETLVSHAVVPRVSWVKRSSLSSATDGVGGGGEVSIKPKQEVITLPFVKHSRISKIVWGYIDMSMQNKMYFAVLTSFPGC